MELIKFEGAMSEGYLWRSTLISKDGYDTLVVGKRVLKGFEQQKLQMVTKAKVIGKMANNMVGVL